MENFLLAEVTFGIVLFAIGLPVALWERRQRERRELAAKDEVGRQGELPFAAEPRRAGPR